MDSTNFRDIFEQTKTIAAVGLSSNYERPSHGVCAFLQTKGYRVIPVNPNEKRVLDERAYPDLDSVPKPVDLVLIFRAPEFAPEIVEAAIRIGAKAIWMQDGAGNEEAAARARQAGLIAVVNDCMMRRYGEFSLGR